MTVADFFGRLPFVVVIGLGACLVYFAARRPESKPSPRFRYKGICAGCGYSLEGLADLTCPECGDQLPGRGTI